MVDSVLIDNIKTTSISFHKKAWSKLYNIVILNKSYFKQRGMQVCDRFCSLSSFSPHNTGQASASINFRTLRLTFYDPENFHSNWLN